MSSIDLNTIDSTIRKDLGDSTTLELLASEIEFLQKIPEATQLKRLGVAYWQFERYGYYDPKTLIKGSYRDYADRGIKKVKEILSKFCDTQIGDLEIFLTLDIIITTLTKSGLDIRIAVLVGVYILHNFKGTLREWLCDS